MKRLYLAALLLALAVGAQDFSDVAFVAAIEDDPVAGGASFTANATFFHAAGTSWMEKDTNWTGNVDSKQGLLSIRAKFSSTNGQGIIYNAAADKVEVNRQPEGTFRVRCRNVAGTTVVQFDQDTAKVPRVTLDTWYHLNASWDTTAGVVTGYLYINKIEAMLTSSRVVIADGIVACGTNDHAIGAAVGGGLDITNSCLSEVWVTFGQTMDLANSANRDKWGGTSDAPISLGATGNTPTGVPPFLYLSNIFSSFTVNSGTGGNLVKKGAVAFTACSDHP